MDTSDYFETLGKKLDASLAAVRAAAQEDRQQLRQRIDKAELDAKGALKDTQQEAGKTAAEARSKWSQMRADASAKMAEAKAKMDQRGQQLDASVAEDDAAWAEADATAAVDFASWAIDNARYASLDAIDARAYADQLKASMA